MSESYLDKLVRVTSAPPRLRVPLVYGPDLPGSPLYRAPRACSCGDAQDHEIARRRTADNVLVSLHSDGQVYRLWFGIGRPLPLPAARVLMSDVELYDAAELPKLHKAARWAWRKEGGHGDESEIRRLMRFRLQTTEAGR